MATTIGRRRFIGLVVVSAASWPLAMRAQQRALPAIEFLGYGSAELSASRVRSFRQGLEAGIVEGRDATIEYRWAEYQTERLPTLASELVSRGINVFAASGSTAAALAAKASTTTISIVFQVGGDPVQLGLVASLNRPGGNITGVANLTVEIGPKGRTPSRADARRNRLRPDRQSHHSACADRIEKPVGDGARPRP